VFERGRQLLKKETSEIVSSWKGVLGVLFWAGLGPTKRPDPTNYKLEKRGSQSPQQENFSSPKNNTY